MVNFNFKAEDLVGRKKLLDAARFASHGIIETVKARTMQGKFANGSVRRGYSTKPHFFDLARYGKAKARAREQTGNENARAKSRYGFFEQGYAEFRAFVQGQPGAPTRPVNLTLTGRLWRGVRTHFGRAGDGYFAGMRFNESKPATDLSPAQKADFIERGRYPRIFRYLTKAEARKVLVEAFRKAGLRYR